MARSHHFNPITDEGFLCLIFRFNCLLNYKLLTELIVIQCIRENFKSLNYGKTKENRRNAY